MTDRDSGGFRIGGNTVRTVAVFCAIVSASFGAGVGFHRLIGTPTVTLSSQIQELSNEVQELRREVRANRAELCELRKAVKAQGTTVVCTRDHEFGSAYLRAFPVPFSLFPALFWWQESADSTAAVFPLGNLTAVLLGFMVLLYLTILWAAWILWREHRELMRRLLKQAEREASDGR
ncbi:MAG TPA: hypothetical protein VNH46_08620 [Gemmatimonadales bacterium]|nr:hypothetical protein [Gemmatimonadales bacterium]